MVRNMVKSGTSVWWGVKQESTLGVMVHVKGLRSRSQIMGQVRVMDQIEGQICMIRVKTQG